MLVELMQCLEEKRFEYLIFMQNNIFDEIYGCFLRLMSTQFLECFFSLRTRALHTLRIPPNCNVRASNEL